MPLKQAMDRKIIVLIFAMGKNPLTHWRHYDVIRDQIFFNFALETTIKVIKIVPFQFSWCIKCRSSCLPKKWKEQYWLSYHQNSFHLKSIKRQVILANILIIFFLMNKSLETKIFLRRTQILSTHNLPARPKIKIPIGKWTARPSLKMATLM